MAKRIITKIGDIFCVHVSEGAHRYFQYVANDMTQLNSSVIRVFKKNYPAGQTINFDEIVRDEVDFYAHCVLAWGIQFGHWQKVGKSQNIGAVEAWFRNSEDYGKPEIIVSNKWYVWKINKEFKFIGRLTDKYKSAEIGVVVTPEDVVKRIRTGAYDFVYPKFE